MSHRRAGTRCVSALSGHLVCGGGVHCDASMRPVAHHHSAMKHACRPWLVSRACFCRVIYGPWHAGDVQETCCRGNAVVSHLRVIGPRCTLPLLTPAHGVYQALACWSSTRRPCKQQTQHSWMHPQTQISLPNMSESLAVLVSVVSMQLPRMGTRKSLLPSSSAGAATCCGPSILRAESQSSTLMHAASSLP